MFNAFRRNDGVSLRQTPLTTQKTLLHRSMQTRPASPLPLSMSVGALILALQSGVVYAETTTSTTPATSTTTAAPSENPVEAVVVTGVRRVSGLKAVDSASPITVLDAATLKRTGQPDLVQALAQNVPSFTAQAAGGDTASLTLAAQLRGLNPNDTLVLINGKRRHTNANLAVDGNPFNGPFNGSAATDLSLIPIAAIDHIEILQDGAAAQYGTDAIAGVVNIILKKDASGGSVSTTGGQYIDGGGKTADASVNAGFAPTDSSFINVTAETKFHGHSVRSSIDPRVTSPANIAAMPHLTSVPGYPNLSPVVGDAAYHLNLFSVNAGIDLNEDLQLYGFGTYGEKTSNAYEIYRLPNALPALYPNGFVPSETIDEKDFAITTGIKGRLWDKWHWDLSTTYGSDSDELGNINTANISLYQDTGSTPTEFHVGKFKTTQWTTNLDVSREFDIGLAKPINLAFGTEYRKDTYAIGQGDPASTYKEGSQAFPGFLATDAGNHSRNNTSLYVDLAANPLEKLKVDLAGRYEKYSDFGSTRVGKLTARYDFVPEFAIRGTVSNGFRAPTLAEEYYSATNVRPDSATVQLPPNAPAAALIGINGLKPEKSQNYSVGFVFKPIPKATITLDAYQIDIRDRIVNSGTLNGSGYAVNSPAVRSAIIANGNILDPSVTKTGISIFSNAVDTRTKGAELVFNYASDYQDYGRVDWSVAASYNTTDVVKINQIPSQLAPQRLLDQAAISDLETATPKYRVNLGALYRNGPWTVSLRESIYGPSSEYSAAPDGQTFYKSTISTKFITDLEIANRITPSVTVAIGANNLFNQYPNKVNGELLAIEQAQGSFLAGRDLPSFSPIGINGGYYYGKLTYTF